MSLPDDAATVARQDALAARFLRYSAISTQSDDSATEVPSSPGQWELARLLRDELLAAGASEVHLSSTCVLTCRIPATVPGAPAVGFCVHLDTADAGLRPEVRARVVDYPGGDLCLDEASGRWLRLDEHPELGAYTGQRLLVTDGASVLGADDKAGIASVMEAAVLLLGPDAPPHGDVHLAIVPDEEIGLRGVRTLDLGRFGVDYAWTLDSCELGEAVWQTFNAASARVLVTGVPAHPMSAKGVLVNPVLVAHDLVALLDRGQTPECTEGTQGFTWVAAVRGDQSTCELEILLRDHDLAGFQHRKQQLVEAVEQVRARHPRAVVELETSDTYGNIADAVTETNRAAIDLLLQAMQELGITAKPLAMRGGTDGSWLSRQGILTPNFFTGAHNFHSWAEFLPLPSFERSHAMVLRLVELAARGR